MHHSLRYLKKPFVYLLVTFFGSLSKVSATTFESNHNLDHSWVIVGKLDGNSPATDDVLKRDNSSGKTSQAPSEQSGAGHRSSEPSELNTNSLENIDEEIRDRVLPPLSPILEYNVPDSDFDPEDFVLMGDLKNTNGSQEENPLSSSVDFSKEAHKVLVRQFLTNPSTLDVLDIEAFSSELVATFGQQMNKGVAQEKLPKEISFCIEDSNGDFYEFFRRNKDKVPNQSTLGQFCGTCVSVLNICSFGYAFPQGSNRIDSHLKKHSPTGRFSIGISLSSPWDCNGQKKEVILVKSYEISARRYLMIKPENRACLSLRHLFEFFISPTDKNHRKERVIKDLPRTLGFQEDENFEQKKYQTYGISYLVGEYQEKTNKERDKDSEIDIKKEVISHLTTQHGLNQCGSLQYRIGAEHIVDVELLKNESNPKSKPKTLNQRKSPAVPEFDMKRFCVAIRAIRASEENKAKGSLQIEKEGMSMHEECLCVLFAIAAAVGLKVISSMKEAQSQSSLTPAPSFDSVAPQPVAQKTLSRPQDIPFPLATLLVFLGILSLLMLLGCFFLLNKRA